MRLLLGIDIADRRLDAQPETASTIGKLDVIARKQKVIRVSFVMEAQAGDDFAARQIVFDIHQRVSVTADRALLLGRLEPRRADPPEYQRSVAHRPDKPENFSGFMRESLPQFRPRQKLEDLRVIVGPKPAVARDRQCGLGDGKVASTVSKLDGPVHVANEKFRRAEGVCRYQCHSEEEDRSEIARLLQRAGP